VLALGKEPTATRVKLMAFAGIRSEKPANQFIHSSLGYSYLTILVRDMDAATARLRAAGVKDLREPVRIRQTSDYLVLVRDPDGNIIELVGPRAGIN